MNGSNLNSQLIKELNGDTVDGCLSSAYVFLLRCFQEFVNGSIDVNRNIDCLRIVEHVHKLTTRLLFIQIIVYFDVVILWFWTLNNN